MKGVGSQPCTKFANDYLEMTVKGVPAKKVKMLLKKLKKQQAKVSRVRPSNFGSSWGRSSGEKARRRTPQFG